MTLTLPLILSLALTASAAAGQTIWRCGPEGRAYSDTPCADGRAVTAADRRSDAERAEAAAVSVREKKALNTLAAQRRQREQEAVERGLGPAAIKRLPAEAAAAPAKPDRKTKRKNDRKRGTPAAPA